MSHVSLYDKADTVSNDTKLQYCESCIVVPVDNNSKYCDACADAIVEWLAEAWEDIMCGEGLY